MRKVEKYQRCLQYDGTGLPVSRIFGSGSGFHVTCAGFSRRLGCEIPILVPRRRWGSSAGIHWNWSECVRNKHCLFGCKMILM